MKLTIQLAKPEDEQELLEFARSHFIGTYAHLNTPENMERYLLEKFTSEPFAKEFSHPESIFFLVQAEDRIAGYVKLNYGTAQTEPDQPNSCEIERIYVHQDLKGQGIGKQLFQTAVSHAHARGADYVWLGVWEKNDKAITFYERIGMKPFGTHNFQLGDDLQTDLLMRFDL